MFTQKVVASADGQTHQPVFKGRFAAKTGQLLKRLRPDFLRDVLHFAFPAGITAGSGEDAWRILGDEWLKARGVAPEHRGDPLTVRRFHAGEVCHAGGGSRTKTHGDSNALLVARRPGRLFDRQGQPGRSWLADLLKAFRDHLHALEAALALLVQSAFGFLGS